MTKWDLLSEQERAELDATPFGGSCSGCGEHLATEGAFARHFTIGDRRYPNLGNCPKRNASPRPSN